MSELKAAQINVQFSLIQKLVFYEFVLGDNIVQ